MSLSTLAILIGLVYCIPQAYSLANPKGFTALARKFPRAEGVGYLLMIVGTIWFLYNLNNEAISDFAAYKKFMLAGFGLLGILTCVFVRDFLAVRGLAVVMLLAAWFTLNHTRWAESQWRLVLVVWAYLWIVLGMWFTVSPWRLRDYLHWSTATDRRIRLGGILRLCFGLLVIVLGATALRS